jgi:glycerol uptake facilitator-like aquaporin
MGREPSPRSRTGLVQRLAAESIGTALLVAVVIGSGIMAERLAGGNAAVALLGNTLATGTALPVLILIFGPISGAHFNPAVTLYFTATRRFRPAEAAGYILLQFAGGIAGALLAHAMFGQPLLQISGHIRSGIGQGLGEFVATLFLLAAIVGTERRNPAATPYACRPRDQRWVLVHLLDLVRQSSRDHRPQLVEHLRRDFS